MAMIDIRPEYVTLAQLFQNRLFRIPQYQRSYSWHSKQRQDLFGDIRQIRENGGGRPHFMATVVGLKHNSQVIGTTDHEFIDIVDGQQRITTLILLLKAIELVIDDNAVRDEISKSLIKDDKATLLLLQTNHDKSDYFANYLKQGEHPPSSEAGNIADRELLEAIEESEAFVHSWQDSEAPLVELVTLLKNRLTFIFHQINDEALVYTVFEVLNSRGLGVSWFDRLKSMLMAIVFEGEGNRTEIIDRVHSLWREIYDCVGLRLGLSTESLRFAATLHSISTPNRPMGEEDAAMLLHRQSEGGPDQVIETCRWIKDVTEVVDQLAADSRISAVTAIVQARLLAAAIYLRKDLKQHEKDVLIAIWEKVTFRIYGMYGRDARTAVGDYVRLAWRVINERLSIENILEGILNIGEQFPIEGAVKNLRNSNCYTSWGDELRYFLHRYEEHLQRKGGQNYQNEHWRHIWTNTAARSIEHIRPQSWWSSHGREGDEGRMHGLGNLLLLPPGLNSRLQDRPEREKADDYTKTGLLIAQEVADIVEESGWNLTEIKNRETHLLRWAAQEWAT